MNIWNKIVNKLSRRAKEAELEHLVSLGLVVGDNLRNHSEYAFDSLFPWLITVGDNVCISSNVKILAHDTSTEYVNGYTKIGSVTIGANVYIGYGATVLCNTRIGNNCIIGAGSVVTSDIPEGSVVAGNPARYICSITEFENKHKCIDEKTKIYNGPCLRWHTLSAAERMQMKEELKSTFGYMK